MIRPICYNIPEGKSEQEALSDELLEALEGVFQGVTHAFGDNATLYRLDIGRVYDTVESGDLVVAGQFVDRSDGEVFDFEINQGTGKVGYKSTGDFLDRQSLSSFLGEKAGVDDNSSESSDSGPYPFDLLLQAIHEESSEAYQSPFASKLRKDLDCLGALSALMYHAGATIEAQPLYTGLHSYAIKYALRGLRLFSQSIGSLQGEDAGKAAEAWVDEHGLDFAAAVIKEFSSRRCARFQESIQTEDQDGIQELKNLVEEAIGMAMSTTTDLIKSVVESEDYQNGDVQATLAAAIDEYCPIDNSEDYSAVDNARQLSVEWQEVVNRSGCTEALSMRALGLPSAETIPSEQGDSQAHQIESAGESPSEDDGTPDGERIFYVNVGEGPSRNWDDCRQFGFLAAGGGRKWSKQLEKIQIGDNVIAYLKGYGYVGIGKVTSTATPATKFLVNGVPIKDLPLINDTFRSFKRFSKENGEYLIGVDWRVAVPREQAKWQSNAGLYTTALVCASLSKQPKTVSFACKSLFVLDKKMARTSPSLEATTAHEWEGFSDMLHDFLLTYTEDLDDDDLESSAKSLLEKCPCDLADVATPRRLIAELSDNLNDIILEILPRIIDLGDESLALFFIGAATLGDSSDELLEPFLDLVDEGMNLNTLVTCYLPQNMFQSTALYSLLFWPEFPDWARALLCVRQDVGFTNKDRDCLVESLGEPSIGRETLVALATDIDKNAANYSPQSLRTLKAFFSQEFDIASKETSSSPEELEAFFSQLDNYSTHKYRDMLRIG